VHKFQARTEARMLNRIIEFSVRNKYLVFALVAAACAWGTWSMTHLPLDAIPDLSETQVIILSRWDRSPDIIEDQVTYPILSAMTGAPHVKTVRGISDFGFSYVYVIFEEGTDLYWARSRTLEYLSSVTARLPPDVRTEMGPDATSLGWVFQYVLKDPSSQHNLGELRSYQDWYLKYYLKAVPGVAEVASLGGFTQQYQVNVDPNRLRSYGIPISRVADAVREGNRESGARLLEFGGAEYMIRGRGYLRSPQDIEDIVLSAFDGAPVRIKDVGKVVIGPDIRRGATDLNGTGEVVSGIVIMREGSNALEVINRVKTRLQEIEPGLPAGVKIVPVYDRSELIGRAISNARLTLLAVILTVVVVIVIFLWHFPSAAIPVVTIPVTVLLTFIPLHYAGVSINVMSLAGIAIACGELVDAAIVVVEQTHKKLEIYERAGKPFSPDEVILAAVQEVAGPTFFALLVIAVAFLPVLALEGQEGKLFRPLAYTKNFAMVVAAVLAIAHPGVKTAAGAAPEPAGRFRRLVPALSGFSVGGTDSFAGRSPDHRSAHALVRAGGLLDAALEDASHCRGARPDPGDDSDVLETGHGIHAGDGRRLDPVHAFDHAGHFDRGIAKAAATDRPDRDEFSGSRSRAGQDGARRYGDRSSAAFDARDGNRAEAASGVARCPHVVFQLGAWMAAPRSAPHHAGPHFGTGLGREDERGGENPGPIEFLDDADSRPDRHAEHRDTHPGGIKDSRRGSGEDSGNWAADRKTSERHSRDAQRVCRARRRRFLSGRNLGPPSAGALRAFHRRRAERSLDGGRRRKHQHHRERTGALPRQRSLSARFPVRSGIAEQGAGVHQWRQADPIIRTGDDSHADRPGDDSQ